MEILAEHLLPLRMKADITQEEDSLVYVSIPEKGGESIIIGKDGDVLYADSSVGYLHNRQAEKFKMVH